MIQKILEFEFIMRVNGKDALEKNVPVGFVITDSGKFCLRYSLSEISQVFIKFEDLIDFVIEDYRLRYP